MADANEAPKRPWLKWLGLQEPPVDPDAWMAVAQDLGVDDPQSGFSEAASRISESLKAGGIEARQRVYARPDQGRTSAFTLQALVGGLPAANRVRIAVLVHNRDLEQARAIVSQLEMPPGENGGTK